MVQTNTMSQWTVLAVAKHYEQYEMGARTRDLWPYLNNMFEAPNHLSSMLHSLNGNGHLGKVKTKARYTGTGHGGTNEQNMTVSGFYPTEDSIEYLEERGEPTEYPDGSPVPDDLDVSIPEKFYDGSTELSFPPIDAPPADGWSETETTKAIVSATGDGGTETVVEPALPNGEEPSTAPPVTVEFTETQQSALEELASNYEFGAAYLRDLADHPMAPNGGELDSMADRLDDIADAQRMK